MVIEQAFGNQGLLVSTEAGENESTETGGVGEARELVVRALADQGESVVTADTFLGKEVLSIPQVGGWIRFVLDYKWIVVGIAGLLVVIGCIPKKRVEAQKAGT